MAALGVAALTGAVAALLLQRFKRCRSAILVAIPHQPPKYVHPPHPTWIPGEPQPHPFCLEAGEEVHIDPATTDKASLYSFVISAVVPRPVGFISTVDADGVGNLAPYSYFNVVRDLLLLDTLLVHPTCPL